MTQLLFYRLNRPFTVKCSFSTIGFKNNFFIFISRKLSCGFRIIYMTKLSKQEFCYALHWQGSWQGVPSVQSRFIILSSCKDMIKFIQGFGSESESGSALLWVSGSGSRSAFKLRRAKMTHKNRKNYRIFMFWSAGCSLLRAEGFSCSLGVLYGGLGISKWQVLIKKIKIKFPAVIFFSILNHQTLDPGVRIRS